MVQTLIRAVDFNSREDLESYIAAEFGRDLAKNSGLDIVIQGKRSELKRLFLSDKTQIWGIKCVITDTPTKDKVKK